MSKAYITATRHLFAGSELVYLRCQRCTWSLRVRWWVLPGGICRCSFAHQKVPLSSAVVSFRLHCPCGCRFCLYSVGRRGSVLLICRVAHLFSQLWAQSVLRQAEYYYSDLSWASGVRRVPVTWFRLVLLPWYRTRVVSTAKLPNIPSHRLMSTTTTRPSGRCVWITGCVPGAAATTALPIILPGILRE